MVKANIPGDIRKPATHEQQLELLLHRNLIIEDEKFALKILKRVNYYRLSAYMLSLKNGDVFRDGATFKQVYKLYEFDKKLRYFLLSILESIEISFRNYITYFLAHRYGSMGYRDSKNFANTRHHKYFIHDINRGISRNDDLFAAGHRDQYDGKLPLWVVIEVTSFGQLSKLYSNLKNDDKNRIARLNYQVPYIYLESWLMLLAYIRNICAHYGRIYNRRLKYMPRLDKKDKGLGFRTDKIFATIFVAGKLCPEQTDWRSFLYTLQALMEEYEEFIELPLLGFPHNWSEILEIY